MMTWRKVWRAGLISFDTIRLKTNVQKPLNIILFTEYVFKAIPNGAGFRAPLGIATGLLKINGHFTGASERQVHPRA